MNTWTCQCGEMNAGALAKCRCGRLREPDQTVSEVQPKMSKSPRSSRKAMTPDERLNKTERAFLQYLRTSPKSWGEIGIQSVTLKLAWDVRYTPDFWAWCGTLHFFEVKGFMRDDARKSLVFAAKTFPWAIFWLVKRDKSQPCGWSITEVRR